MTIPIQLSVQGGAAKLALLIAFMEAVEELHDQQVLRVTKIAGTSAGAIAGTLFAARVPMATVRNRLGAAPLEKIVPKAGWMKTLGAMAAGKPVWSEDEFEKLLKILLGESLLLREEPPKQLLTFDDIKTHRNIEVKVVATDLRSGRPAIRDGGYAIVGSLLDSAAVPFFFRSRNSKNATTVDGGLCANLPSDELSDNEEDGPIVAVSFLRREGKNPEGLLEYSLAVVGAGMDYSTDKAKNRMEERAAKFGIGHEAYSIDSKIESLDFEKAISQGLGEFYEPVRDAAKSWLQEFVRRRQLQIQEKKEQSARQAGQLSAERHEIAFYKAEMPKNLAKMYKAQHECHLLRWSDARLEVVVSADAGQADSVDYFCEFYSLDQPVWCQRVPMLVAKRAEVKLPWEFFYPDRRRIDPYYMIMDDDGNPETLEWLVCFDSPLPPNTGPYQFRLNQSVPGFADKLRTTGTDDFWVSFRRAQGKADKAEVIVRVPEKLGTFKAEPKSGAGESKEMTEFEVEKVEGYESFGYRGLQIDPAGWGIWVRKN